MRHAILKDLRTLALSLDEHGSKLVAEAADALEHASHGMVNANSFIDYTYKLRQALGFNNMYSLNNLVDDAGQMRNAVTAAAPIACLAIEAADALAPKPEGKLGYIGNADEADTTPVTVTITATLGQLRTARRLLWLIQLWPSR